MYTCLSHEKIMSKRHKTNLMLRIVPLTLSLDVCHHQICKFLYLKTKRKLHLPEMHFCFTVQQFFLTLSCIFQHFFSVTNSSADTSCPPLFPPKHGYLECSRPIASDIIGADANGSGGRRRITNRPGSQCVLRCPTGFRIDGKFSKQCSASGIWVGESDGICIRTYCGFLIIFFYQCYISPRTVASLLAYRAKTSQQNVKCVNTESNCKHCPFLSGAMFPPRISSN